MITVHRKPYNSDLTSRQWECVEPLLPKPKKTGRRRADDRETIDGILYVLSTGCRWKDMPHDIDASPSTCHRRFQEYEKRGVWKNIQGELMKEADRKGKINWNNNYHDGSVVKSKRGRNVR